MDFTTYGFSPGRDSQGRANVHIYHELCGIAVYQDGGTEPLMFDVARDYIAAHNARCPRLMSEAAQLAMARA